MIKFLRNRAAKKLAKAVQTNDLSALETLLASGVDPNYVVGKYDNRPLYNAVEGQWLEGVQALLSAGAKCNELSYRSEVGRAIDAQWSQGLKMLLYAGAAHKAWCLPNAVKHGWQEGVDILLDDGVSQSELNFGLHAAIFYKNNTIASQLLEVGAEVDLPVEHITKEPETALIRAITSDNANIIPELIERLMQKTFKPTLDPTSKDQLDEGFNIALSHGHLIACKMINGGSDLDEITYRDIDLIIKPILNKSRDALDFCRKHPEARNTLIVLGGCKPVLDTLLRDTRKLLINRTELSCFSECTDLRYSVQYHPPIGNGSPIGRDGVVRPPEGPRHGRYACSMPVDECIEDLEKYIRDYENAIGCLNRVIVA